MWRRRSWFSLNGKVGVQGSEEEQTSYIAPGCGAIGRIHATTPHQALPSPKPLRRPVEPTREFFAKNRFVGILDKSEYEMLGPENRSKCDRLVAACLGFTQKTRSQFLAVCANGRPTIIDFDGEDPLPKPLMRAAAMAASGKMRNPEQGAEYDIKVGLDLLSDYLYVNRHNSKRLRKLQELIAERRGARGLGGPISAKDQLLLAEVVYDYAIIGITPRDSSSTQTSSSSKEDRAEVPPSDTKKPTEHDGSITRTSTASQVSVEEYLASSTTFFAERFAKAFPGVRSLGSRDKVLAV